MFKAILDLIRERALMKGVYEDVATMLDLAYSHFGAAASALLDGEALDFDVYAADRRVNARVIAIRKRIVKHLTVNRPTDIVGELVFLTVINDIERVGDYAKTLVDTKHELSGPLPESRYLDGLREQRDLILSTFPLVQEALLEGDSTAGAEAIARLDSVRELSEGVLSALFDETELTPAHAISLGLACRVFKRAAKHLRNVASSAVSPFVLIGYANSNYETFDDEDAPT